MPAFLLILAIVLAAALLYLSRLPRDYEVRRSLFMRTDRRTVFDRVREFPSWSDWSPWLLHEPEAKRHFSAAADQPDGYYTWDGRTIGAGRLTHVRFDEPGRIEQRLEIQRPFKSGSEVWWEFTEADGGTEVAWCLRGRMPFLLRPMIPMVREMIGKDYELGLARLRGCIDPDAGGPELCFEGETTLEPHSALVIPFSGGMDAMIRAMEDGFPRLAAHLASLGVAPSGPPFSAYHKVDIKKKTFRCDIVLPAPAGIDPGPFDRKDFSGGRHYRVTLTGSYDFLELAWYAAIAHARMLKLKLDKHRPMLEVYENDPADVASPRELRTALYLPLR
ncbi:MAG: SRPBCC family protein [Lamprocystis purpurea]|jgi:effector-binding domain-containing protein|uniref:SRPBCC family protein n=1 Tax=Lamprocystis purpurea TaxID=61598 RepID=UPI00037498AC|nr:SRPBCC family protein [Lamprocystis purpurea]MBV5273052.1 SRPBCC family protein [Lamprocystis purpurea]